ncbi:Putative chromate reductase [Pedobacter sp. BAL39]|uniref:NADPH-dependent FMN reductase n=1 Tax=Pedobacter sp. BAL39 TaxID=391596 RepID=UPI00015595F0|nr:NAD(P)H-dependent oxidoreductase [Pedobacter sp. BAL39]EDM38016.1 Putative chromate reductase [Pedobacter sp. BAL39]
MSKVIGIIAGSLRKESFSKKLAIAVRGMAPEGFDFRIISIADLPIYNQDFDDNNEVPEAYTVFRNEANALNGIVFITPEYNRSVPGVLKNVIDVGSRPYGKSVWDGKPAAIFSNSPGNIAAFGANHHLRQSLVFLNMPIMQQPEVYLPNVSDLFDDSGDIKDGSTKDFLKKAIDAYIAFFQKNSK